MNSISSGHLVKMPPARDIDDTALLAGIAAGDEESLGRLVDKYRRRILAQAERATGSAADAEEILQETLLKVWMIAPKWRRDGAATFATWLHRVVANACVDRRRRRTFAPLDDAGDPAEEGLSGLDNAARRESYALIVTAIAKLPRRQREALSLAYFGGTSSPEAARLLGVSVGTFESLLFRAKRALRAVLLELGVAGLLDILL